MENLLEDEKRIDVQPRPPRMSHIGSRIWSEWRFISALISVNIASAMEYRASFISQVIGMVLNNSIMLVFWLIFFDKFEGAIAGYGFREVFLLYGLVAFAFGLAYMLGGNIFGFLAYLIAQGRLDYYLVFPRNLLLHVVFSRMQISAIGDLFFGIAVVAIIVGLQPLQLLLAAISVVLTASIIIAYGVTIGSLSFFIGNAQNAAMQFQGGLVTFAMYPSSLFRGLPRLLLMTLIPSIFLGAVPAELILQQDGRLLAGLFIATAVLWLIALAVFYTGVRRYESGSAINVNV